jgi:DNA ligase-1
METKELLESLKCMTLELLVDNSTYHKQSVLRNYPECKEVLEIIYDPLINFYVTGSNVLNYMEEHEYATYESEHRNITLIRLLKTLRRDKKIRGHRALNLCGAFIEEYYNYEDLIINILNKDLKCGISTKTINKVWPNLIPEFNVPKAKDYKENLCDFHKERWYISRKLDGIRCLIFITENTINAYSRDGREFFTLNKVLEELSIKYRSMVNIVLDGELCIVNEEGGEDFKSIVSEIRRKDHTIENPLFHVFDAYTIDIFHKSTKTSIPYRHTYNFLKSSLSSLEHTKVLEHQLVTSEKAFTHHIKEIPDNWEGYMLRRDGSTYFKRSNNLLKVKKFKDEEFTVLNLKKSEKFIDGVNQPCIGSLEIKYKSSIVSVGSGLTDKQRLDWYKHPENIIGKRVTIKYFEESKDKNGRPSLRFPILKHVWDGEKI